VVQMAGDQTEQIRQEVGPPPLQIHGGGIDKDSTDVGVRLLRITQQAPGRSVEV
jgi:hypothetical protein